MLDVPVLCTILLNSPCGVNLKVKRSFAGTDVAINVFSKIVIAMTNVTN